MLLPVESSGKCELGVDVTPETHPAPAPGRPERALGISLYLQFTSRSHSKAAGRVARSAWESGVDQDAFEGLVEIRG